MAVAVVAAAAVALNSRILHLDNILGVEKALEESSTVDTIAVAEIAEGQENLQYDSEIMVVVMAL